MNQNVIVAVDHSAQAENAVKYYLDKLHRRGNKLILVHGIELPELSLHNARECHVSPAVLASMWREEEAKCKNLEEKMKVMLKGRGVSARLRSCPGKPGEVVCRIALEENASYVVIGTRGRSGTLKRTVLGTVSDDIIRHAPCPVLVCRAAAEVERQRRRHASADTGERAEAITRRRSASGGDKVRHKSGDALTTFASSLRHRFSSGGGSSRMARSFDNSSCDDVFFESSTVLYPISGLPDPPPVEQHEIKTSTPTPTITEEVHKATVEQ